MKSMHLSYVDFAPIIDTPKKFTSKEMYDNGNSIWRNDFLLCVTCRHCDARFYVFVVGKDFQKIFYTPLIPPMG